MLLSLLSFAHAETGCLGASVLGVVPADGSVGVPTDVEPAVLVDPGGPCATVSWELQLRAGSGEYVASKIALSEERLLVVDGPIQLDENTTYQVILNPQDGEGSGIVTSFTTGSDEALVKEIAPVGGELVATWSGGLVQYTASVQPGEDPYDMGVLGLLTNHDGPPTYALVGDATSVTLSGFHQTSPMPDEWCVAIGQRDAVGDWSPKEVCGTVHEEGWVEETAVVPQDTASVAPSTGACGCASGSLGGGLLLGLASVLAARRATRRG